MTCLLLYKKRRLHNSLRFFLALFFSTRFQTLFFFTQTIFLKLFRQSPPLTFFFFLTVISYLRIHIFQKLKICFKSNTTTISSTKKLATASFHTYNTVFQIRKRNEHRYRIHAHERKHVQYHPYAKNDNRYQH